MIVFLKLFICGAFLKTKRLDRIGVMLTNVSQSCLLTCILHISVHIHRIKDKVMTQAMVQALLVHLASA
jgi:hypothetical protein